MILVVLFLRRGLINMLTSGPLKVFKAGPSGLELEYFDRTLNEAKVNVGLPADKPRRRSIWDLIREKFGLDGRVDPLPVPEPVPVPGLDFSPEPETLHEPEAPPESSSEREPLPESESSRRETVRPDDPYRQWFLPNLMERGYLREVAAISPTSAILESFALLEAQLRDKLWAILPEYVGKRTTPPMSELLSIARHEGVFTSAEAKSVDELAALRNALAHGRARNIADTNRAYSYLDVVDRLCRIIEHASLRPRKLPTTDDPT
ncbi:hypothetical protein OHS58_48430 [Amycolatopsis sp. NBC_00348]|uniref:hypothetical protein n=1 Tax=Amycolatopsis sp. NBC_00348 TaxID=2975956 RepID=UPI002E25CAF4